MTRSISYPCLNHSLAQILSTFSGGLGERFTTSTTSTPRYWITHGLEMTEERRAAHEPKRRLGYAALGVMEGHLKERAFFVGERYSVADIALYAYTHVAREGGFDLDGFPAVRTWLERVAAQPGHVPITQS